MNNDKIHTLDTPPGEFFFGALRDMNDGKMLKQLDGGLQRLISEALRTGGKGKIVLSLTVSKRGGNRQVLITPAVKLDEPKEELRNRLLFADETGRLYQDDPAQGQLDFDAPKKVEGKSLTITVKDEPKKINL